MTQIAIATWSQAPELEADDRLLLPALARRGITGVPCVWDDPSVDWSRFATVIVRSTWDSHLRRDAFLVWAEALSLSHKLLNPARVLRWNTHKSYLRELESAGIPVTPTAWVGALDTPDLGSLAEARGWSAIVIKPAVSAGARGTHVIHDPHSPDAQALFDSLGELGERMVQPYLASFEKEGERSYLFFNGRFSHAVRRPPGIKDSPRAFEEPHAMAPQELELALAQRVIEASPGPLLYARVDIATAEDGRPRLQELEATEPALFLGSSDSAAGRFAEAIESALAL